MSNKSFMFFKLGLTQFLFSRSQLKSPAMVISLFRHPFYEEFFLNIVEIQYLNLVGDTRLTLRLVCNFNA